MKLIGKINNSYNGFADFLERYILCYSIIKWLLFIFVLDKILYSTFIILVIFS